MFDRNNSLPLSLFLQAERQARLDSLVIKAFIRESGNDIRGCNAMVVSRFGRIGHSREATRCRECLARRARK